MEDKDLSASGGSNAVWNISLERWKDFLDLMRKGEGRTCIKPLIDTGGCDLNAIKYKGRNLLFYATKYGDQGLVKYLLQKGADPYVDRFGSEPCLLHLAAAKGHADIMDIFLTYGVSINARDKFGSTAMHEAASRCRADIVKFLLDEDALFDEVNDAGETPLLKAAHNGHASIVAILIKAGADFARPDFRKGTVLWYALKNGWLEVVQLLANKGIDFDLGLPCHEIPLFTAVKAVEKDIVKFLLDWGVNVNRRDQWKYVTWSSAAEYDDYLRSDHSSYTPIQYCYINWFSCTFPVHSESMLHDEIEKVNIMELLLKGGADCNIKGGAGKSIFDHILRCRDKDMLNFCVENKALFYEELNPSFKWYFLQNVEICTSLLIDKFNDKDLPLLYKINNVADSLPSVEDMKICDGMETMRFIKIAVGLEIRERGYYNIFERKPIVLKMLAVESLLSHHKE